MELKGKVALVTGASSGIGKASALLLAKEGAKVGVLDIDEEEVGRTVKRIERRDGTALDLVADVSVPEQVGTAIERLGEEYGRIDVVFANAGINGVWAPIEELGADEFRRTMAVNLLGTFLTVKYATPYLKKRGGSVIVTSSVNGTRIFSNTGATAYSCSKAAQVAFVKMVALELAPHRIRVNVICPGAVETNIGESTETRDLEEVKIPVEYPEGEIPLKPGEPARPEDIARVVLFLASDGSRYISGTEIWVDAGLSLLQG